MGRAIVRYPQVFLFNEPPSNLDAKLRVKMRSEIKELHQHIGTTTIYLTHDHTEAVTMANKNPSHEMGLVPANGTFERYKLQEMLAFLSTEIHKGFIPLFYAAGDYLEIARPKLEKRYAWINEHLADKQFLMGDTFTVADTYLFAVTGWGHAHWLKSYEDTPIHFDDLQHLQAWYERVKSRAAVQKSILEEGLELN